MQKTEWDGDKSSAISEILTFLDAASRNCVVGQDAYSSAINRFDPMWLANKQVLLERKNIDDYIMHLVPYDKFTYYELSDLDWMRPLGLVISFSKLYMVPEVKPSDYLKLDEPMFGPPPLPDIRACRTNELLQQATADYFMKAAALPYSLLAY